MARVTVEDCLEKENNRFRLVRIASKRAKQILTGESSVKPDPQGNKPVVFALREIANGEVRSENHDPELDKVAINRGVEFFKAIKEAIKNH